MRKKIIFNASSAGLFLFCLALLTIFSGCITLDSLFGKKVEKSPDELMYEGMRNLEKGRYTAASEAFQTIKDRYPYSKYAIEAEFRIGDALYKRELYEEAFQAYDDFEKLHPRNENIPYIIYQKGMCYVERFSSIDRDQGTTLDAKAQFERLIKKFPRHAYADRGRKRLRECLIALADYELYVAHFYFKSKEYNAAMNRYLYLIENYPDFGQYHEAIIHLNKCREELQKQAEERSLSSERSWWQRLTPSFLH